MIYLSSACSTKKKIGEAVQEIANLGFKNIELTGGTQYYDEYERDLLKLQDKYHLNYLVHNYFPPPQESFVLNLASLNQKIYQQSLEHCYNAIALSKRLNAKKLGFHAGFLIDIRVREIGGKLSKDALFEKEKAVGQFCNAFNLLKEIAEDKVTLYIENNVFSRTNSRTYKNQNPFMLTDYQSYLELKDTFEFFLLLDLGHLKVSSQSLKLSFPQEIRSLLPLSNYIHLSENDGFHDQNRGFTEDAETLKKIKQYDFSNKTITLEIYRKLETIHEDYQIVEKHLNLGDKK